MSDAKKLPDFIFKSGIGPESMNEELFIGRFMEEMRSGLRGESGSLGMIPTYISCSADLPESGFAVAIDAGGTNFRTALVRFEGGKVSLDKFDTVPMPGTQGAVTWAEFIRFAADSHQTIYEPYAQNRCMYLVPDGDHPGAGRNHHTHDEGGQHSRLRGAAYMPRPA